MLLLVIHQRKREKRSSKIGTTAKVIITSTHYHLSEGRIEEGTSQELSGVIQPSFIYLKPNFAYILIKVLMLVLRQRKWEKRTSKIETSAKVILTRTHHHLSEGIIEEGTSQELSGVIQPSFIYLKPNFAYILIKVLILVLHQNNKVKISPK